MSTSNTAPSARGPKYFVNLEGTDYEWDHDSITVPETRELAGWDATQPIVEVDLDDNSERTLAEGETVKLKPGHGFAKKVKFQRGRADWIAANLDLLRSAHPEIEYRADEGQHWVRIPAFDIPPGAWKDELVELAFRIPASAGEAPYGFWVRPEPELLAPGPIQNYTPGATTPWGGGWGHFSLQPAEQWLPKEDVRAGANMLHFVSGMRDRLRDGA